MLSRDKDNYIALTLYEIGRCHMVLKNYFDHFK